MFSFVFASIEYNVSSSIDRMKPTFDSNRPRNSSTKAAQEEFYFYGSKQEVFEVKVLEPASHFGKIPETLVQDIWELQQFSKASLHTTDGTVIQILRSGKRNRDSGPDFLLARVELNNIVWTGAVEVHTYSSAWFEHKHHKDPIYNSSILHVTLFSDHSTGKLTREDGTFIPELVLQPLLQSPLRTLIYNLHTSKKSSFPCESHWPGVPDHIKSPWLSHLAKNRLRARKKDIEQRYLDTPSFEDVLHKMLFKGMGYVNNDGAMEELARRIPLRVSRLTHTLTELEALHFGVAGLLPGDHAHLPQSSIEYVKTLQQHFERLQDNFKLPVMSSNWWQFFRLRPANFPTLRIAQAVSLLSRGHLLHHDPIGQILHALQQEYSLSKITSLFRVPLSPFWNTHYRFSKDAPAKNRVIGDQRIKKLLINVVAPIALTIAEQSNIPELEARTNRLLAKMSAEKDHITNLFEKKGYFPPNSIASQGIHELYSTYCSRSQCLHCQIGTYIIHS